MKTKLFIIALFPLLFSCDTDREKLKGHWHLHSYNEHYFLNENEYSTIDFDENGFATFDKYGFYQSYLAGDVNVLCNSIYRAMECITVDCKYEWKNDSLFLNDLTFNEYYFAEKCEEGCCDKQKDFFNHEEISIDLPIIKDTSKAFLINKFKSEFFEKRLLIGVVENTGYGFPEVVRLKIEGKYARSEDMEILVEEIRKNSFSKNKEDVFITIYSNQKTDLQFIL